MDMIRSIEAYWTEQAPTFDDEPDHGLADPEVRKAWAARLREWLPPRPVTVADLGCGTGSLSVLLAEAGANVVGVDLSPAMIDQARRKASASGVPVEFVVGNAATPDLRDGSFDVVLSRHLLWTLADPVGALDRWTRLLNPSGRFVLIEGRWCDPSQESNHEPSLPWDGGVTAAQLTEALDPLFDVVDHYPLSHDSGLWGKTVKDERYAVVTRALRRA